MHRRLPLLTRFQSDRFGLETVSQFTKVDGCAFHGERVGRGRERRKTGGKKQSMSAQR